VSFRLKGIWDVKGLKAQEREELITLLANTVAKISEIKGAGNPMIGAKIMHFMFPEFFPVWDTKWIKNKCLSRETYELRKKIRTRLGDDGAAVEYATFLHFLITDVLATRKSTYDRLQEIFRKKCAIRSQAVIDEFFGISHRSFSKCVSLENTSNK